MDSKIGSGSSHKFVKSNVHRVKEQKMILQQSYSYQDCHVELGGYLRKTC